MKTVVLYCRYFGFKDKDIIEGLKDNQFYVVILTLYFIYLPVLSIL